MPSKLVTALLLFLIAASFLYPVSNLVCAATTYSITISTIVGDFYKNQVPVPITLDGQQTGYYTPHTFKGLSGTHNVTVPYLDSKRHPFRAWSKGDTYTCDDTPTDPAFNTVTFSSGYTFQACYDIIVPRPKEGSWDVSPAEQRFYVTPTDPSVIALASNKSWFDIINWVSANIANDTNRLWQLLNATLNLGLNYWQYPNETLYCGAGGYQEYSTLAVSMLTARGYSAYVVTGNLTASNSTREHAWIALKLNDVWYHFEPQRSWAHQPSSKEFKGYSPRYFFNDADLLAAIPTSDPPPAQTYDITINTQLETTLNGNSVAIIQDGLPTGFTTPHTFVGLSGVHNFTVPYIDNNHPFQAWNKTKTGKEVYPNITPGSQIFPTINVSSSCSVTAYYALQFNVSQMYPAQFKFLITPSDSAVIKAAGVKSWNDILAYTSSIPYGAGTSIQFPNQTIAKGTIRSYIDTVPLCCSMLKARGYNAFMVVGNIPRGPDLWVVLIINGTAYPIDPNSPLRFQQTDVTVYQAAYYIDENGIYPPSDFYNLQFQTAAPTPTPTPPPTPTPSATPVPTRTHAPIPIHPTLNSTGPLPLLGSTNYPEPSQSVPELPTLVLLALIPLTFAFVILIKRRAFFGRRKHISCGV